MNNKQSIREAKRLQRKKLSHNQALSASIMVASNLQKLMDWQEVKLLHCYLPIIPENEIDSTVFLDLLQESNKNIRLFCPLSKIKNKLVSVEMSDAMDLRSPTHQESSETSIKKFDVIIVPLIAFDKKLNRIGFGGGAYDRFLSSQKDAIKIGLGYEISRVEEIPAENHDIKLTYIVTEKAIYR